MTILDANVLLYAYNSDSPQQTAASRWLTTLLESGEPVGLPWVTIWAFVRIATNFRIFTQPLPTREAFAIVAEWLALPGVLALAPGPRHLELLQKLALEQRASGPLVTDAILAAHALEHGARLASTDGDFGRFSGLNWVNPLAR